MLLVLIIKNTNLSLLIRLCESLFINGVQKDLLLFLIFLTQKIWNKVNNLFARAILFNFLMLMFRTDMYKWITYQ